MEPKRLGGALLTSVSTGVGILVPYTFKTLSPALMAFLWAVLVFAGIVGLVLALKPADHAPHVGSPPAAPHAPRKPLIDPDFADVFGWLLAVPLVMLGLLLVFGTALTLIKGISWIASL